MHSELSIFATSSLDERTPVRRHSRRAGRCESIFWQPTPRQGVRDIVFAAELHEREHRQPGERNGPVGFIGIEVIRYLANRVSYRSGRLDPSIKTIARKIKRAPSAVCDALKALRQHGWLDWIRRYLPTDNEGSKGPQVRQTSNAYRLCMPPKGLWLLARWGGGPPPPPDDYSHAREAQEAENDAYRASLPSIEWTLFDVDEGPVKEALARFMVQRDSAGRSEPHTGQDMPSAAGRRPAS